MAVDVCLACFVGIPRAYDGGHRETVGRGLVGGDLTIVAIITRIEVNYLVAVIYYSLIEALPFLKRVISALVNGAIVR